MLCVSSGAGQQVQRGHPTLGIDVWESMACKNSLVGEGKAPISTLSAKTNSVSTWPSELSHLATRTLQAIYLGDFDTQEAAAHMYDRAAICVHGFDTVLNYDRSFYDSEELSDGWVGSEEQLLSILNRFNQNGRYTTQELPFTVYVPIMATGTMLHA